MAAFLIHHTTQCLAHKFVGRTETVRVSSLLDVSFQFRCQTYAHVLNIFQVHWGFKLSLADRDFVVFFLLPLLLAQTFEQVFDFRADAAQLRTVGGGQIFEDSFAASG